MRFYKTNAIYDSLKGSNLYSWVSGDAWILVYGDCNSVPKLIAFVNASSWRVDNDILEKVGIISRATSIPSIRIEFDDTSNEINEVKLYNGSSFSTLSLDELKDLFRRHGVPVSAALCTKAVNDATSSAYHNWQRASLGNITVSDIDLIQLQDGKISSIIELKRSKIDLLKWTPYRNDYPNFILLSNLCSLGSMRFIISYNLRTTTPNFFDDPSRIKMFFYDKRFELISIEYKTLDEFRRGCF